MSIHRYNATERRESCKGGREANKKAFLPSNAAPYASGKSTPSNTRPGTPAMSSLRKTDNTHTTSSGMSELHISTGTFDKIGSVKYVLVGVAVNMRRIYLLDSLHIKHIRCRVPRMITRASHLLGPCLATLTS